ncbi:sensor histidine kinase [Frigidibacter sp. MR17.24]|uniref:sensor histidine kinase n=1 Tax=Frigidibacter sp. MR17.24 TaxID=3127345 RepID=UPI003012F695
MTTEPRGRSIRRRMMTLIALGFLGLLAVNSALLWTYAGRAANGSFDLLLGGAAQAMLERTRPTPEGPTVDLPPTALQIMALAPRERVVYRVFSPGEGEITGTPGLPLPRGFAASDSAVFYDAPFGGEVMRFVVQGRMLTSPAGRTWVEVQIGQTREARIERRRSLFLIGMAGVALVSAIGLACVWFAIGAALRPLLQIETELQARPPSDLSELRLAPPREIVNLIGAINGFIARLRANRALTETFIADVAHQTRTSLSALQGQISLAADATDIAAMRGRVARAEQQSARLVRLTNQLLAQAMVIHRTEAGNLSAVALVPLLRDFLGEALRDPRYRKIVFSLDVAPGIDADGLVRGDPVALREALRNLVDNAFRYGPEDNLIDIALDPAGDDALLLSVSDAGPGIAPGDRDRAQQRFTSLSGAPGGSGLGLSIVRAVAEGHGGQLRLERSRHGGLRAGLLLQRVAAVLAALWLVAAPRPALADLSILHMASATDYAAIGGLIRAFETANPDVRVAYQEIQTVPLHDAVLAGRVRADLVVSPAMDLQVDLVNRGLARPLDVPGAERLPAWASWRQELFGFTFEPAVILYRRDRFAATDLPRTHQELATFIRLHENELRGRLGTYDLGYSGIGYLYATQDAELGIDASRLNETMGRAAARVYCCSSEMIGAAVADDLSMALNVIGSYAMTATDPRTAVHLLDDYNLVMTRTAFVPRTAENPELGLRFLQFVLSEAGQRSLVTDTRLLPILPPADVSSPALEQLRAHEGTFLPIRLDPGLLTYLDRLKHEQFMAGWKAALRSEGSP